MVIQETPELKRSYVVHLIIETFRCHIHVLSGYNETVKFTTFVEVRMNPVLYYYYYYY